MNEFFERVWGDLVARTEGPMHLRFILQPTMSLLFTILAIIRDTKDGKGPFLERLIKSKGQRGKIMLEAWKDVGKIWVIGIILDVIYQLVVIYKFKTETRFYPLESVIVPFFLAMVPYILLRGPVDRIVRRFKGKSKLGKVDGS